MGDTIDDIIDTPRENYIDKILSFDYNQDGFIRMYSRMGPQQAVPVMQDKALRTRPGKERGEIWLSTSLKHSRQFENKIVKDHADDCVIAFRVDLKRFCELFQNEDIIPQRNSSATNRGVKVEDLKCLVNGERLNEHPWEKINICLKGQANADKFNKCIDSLTLLKVRAERGQIIVYNPSNMQDEASSESIAAARR